MKVTINIDENEKKILDKRAKKNLLSLREQVEDIIRRSCVRGTSSSSSQRVDADDRLVHIFSREMRGKKRKR